MSRYDKYDPKVGGFRAKLAADFGYTASKPDRAHADLSKLFAAGLSTTGLVGKWDGTTGSPAFPNFVGVFILTMPKAAGDVVDVMTDGEIVDLVAAEVSGTLAAGQKLYADASVTTGVLQAGGTVATGDTYVGTTVELNTTTGRARLVVRSTLGRAAA